MECSEIGLELIDDVRDLVAIWRIVGSDVGQISEAALHWARLVLGWVNVSGFNSWSGKFISV